MARATRATSGPRLVRLPVLREALVSGLLRGGAVEVILGQARQAPPRPVRRPRSRTRPLARRHRHLPTWRSHGRLAGEGRCASTRPPPRREARHRPPLRPPTTAGRAGRLVRERRLQPGGRGHPGVRLRRHHRCRWRNARRWPCCRRARWRSTSTRPRSTAATGRMSPSPCGRTAGHLPRHRHARRRATGSTPSAATTPGTASPSKAGPPSSATAGPCGHGHPTSTTSSPPATAAAGGPAAPPRSTGATSTTSTPGRTAAPPTPTTASSSAAATTASSTQAGVAAQAAARRARRAHRARRHHRAVGARGLDPPRLPLPPV